MNTRQKGRESPRTAPSVEAEVARIRRGGEPADTVIGDITYGRSYLTALAFPQKLPNGSCTHEYWTFTDRRFKKYGHL